MNEAAATASTTGPKILFIDDEKNVLAGIHRHLRKDFNIVPALSGAEGLRSVDKHRPAVVVCDMRMPGMDGVETLAEIEKRSPETIRIMLTGNADQETAVNAINHGRIFRFLSKPSSPEVLKQALEDALRQHELLAAEKSLLSQTLTGSVRALVDILSLVAPEALGQSNRVRQWARVVADELSLVSNWELDMAAMLYPIGLVSAPPGLVTKAAQGADRLTSAERAVIARIPEIGRRLLMHIPRLARVSEIIYYQDRGYDGTGTPEKGPVGTSIPLESRILKVLKRLAVLTPLDTPSSASVAQLTAEEGPFDPSVVDAVGRIWGLGSARTRAATVGERMPITLDTILPNDLLQSPVMSASGKLLLSEGIRVTAAQIERLRNFRELEPVREPIMIERAREA